MPGEVLDESSTSVQVQGGGKCVLNNDYDIGSDTTIVLQCIVDTGVSISLIFYCKIYILTPFAQSKNLQDVLLCF